MKNYFPEYKHGDTDKVRDKLPKKSRDMLNDFLKKCSITAKTPEKIRKIERHILQFFDVVEKPLDEITKQDVDSFLVILNNLPEESKALWTKNEIKCYLKKFLKDYYKSFEMVENIHLESKRIAHKISENDLITSEDVEAMLRHAENYREKALLFLEFETGARPEEILNLKWKDIDFKEDYADVKLFSHKTGNTRTFPVNRAKHFLLEWKQNFIFSDINKEDYIFPSIAYQRQGSKNVCVPDRKNRMTTAGVNKLFRRLAKKAGIEKDVWSYLFRHSRATKIYEELPTPIVEKLMGHKNMYATYAHISGKKAREEMINKIYKIKELSPEQKNKYEIQLEEQKKELDELKTLMQEVLKRTKGTLSKIK